MAWRADSNVELIAPPECLIRLKNRQFS